MAKEYTTIRESLIERLIAYKPNYDGYPNLVGRLELQREGNYQSIPLYKNDIPALLAWLFRLEACGDLTLEALQVLWAENSAPRVGHE